MIIRKDEQWTTIQCKNLVADDGRKCNLCFKVLNGRFALTQQCPYCLGSIDLRSYPEAREEDTIGYRLKKEATCAHCFGQGKGDCPEC